jgi:hypothetical protein
MQRLHALFLALFIATGTSAQIASGLYEGLEKNAAPYYHHCLLLVAGDSLFLYKTPMLKVKGKMVHSASDGGFHYFYGSFSHCDTSTIIQLTEYNCDYCAYRVNIDSSTGFMYPIPRQDTFRLTRTNLSFNIGTVTYHKSTIPPDDFPPRSLFYPDLDSNYIYREEPKGQYPLISTGIKNFLETRMLTLDHDTLRICLDRKVFDSVVETLDPRRIQLDTADIMLCFYTKAELKRLTASSARPVRYIQLAQIIDYWRAARIEMTYVISLPRSIHHFSEREYHALFEYKKSANNYVLIGDPSPPGWSLVEQQ